MSDQRISEANMLAGLRDIDLPARETGGVIAEICILIGLAGLAGLLVAMVLWLFLVPRPTAAQQHKDELASLAALPEEHRRVVLLHLLRNRAPEHYANIKDRLYLPGAELSLRELEAEVRRSV
ncbi:MAG: hypothetical protein AAF922_12390 [Pseudomonadota bacterium]